MNELQIFNNEEFGEIRTVLIDNQPWFVGKDIANALGYANTRVAIQDNVDDCDKGVTKVTTSGGMQDATVINESGMYALVFGSKKESAKRFKHWVTSEVLPSIRKNGGYIAGQEQLSDSELMAKALLVANKTIEERNKQIEAMRFANGLLEKEIEENKPKTIFADAVSTSHTSILVGDLAKLISQNGYAIGQKRLFEWLRSNGYFIKAGTSYNMPCQRYVEQGFFEVKESTLQNPDGSVRITRTPKVTGKGQIYFVNKFLGDMA